MRYGLFIKQLKKSMLMNTGMKPEKA